jgi:hypothetical protein
MGGLRTLMPLPIPDILFGMAADPAADLAALEITSDHATRNQLALRLAGARVPGTPDVLLRLIAREDLVNHRGTLVHSLGQFDCSGYVPALAHLVVTGNFEVAHEAFNILDNIEYAAGPTISSVNAQIKSALSVVGEDWRRELLRDLLGLFE